MNILIIGFQRSGTTLLRRILHSHPDVRRMFHEEFLLKRYPTKAELQQYLKKYNIDFKLSNWGEKVPLYPSARGMSAKVYCEKWTKYFGKQGKILHIVRHPIDVGFSIDKKYKAQKFIKGIRIYKRVMPAVVENLIKMPNCFSFKYEELLIHPDKKVKEILNFCRLKQFDYKEKLSQITNKKYKTIDSSRAFAYRKKSVPKNLNLESMFNILNQIDGEEYKL